MATLVSKQIAVIVSFVILNLLAIIAMGIRFYSIRVVRRQIKRHDILCIVSLVMLFAYSIDLLVATVDGGIGLHVTQVSLPTMEVGLKTFTTKGFRWSAYAVMVAVCLFFIASITTTLRLCRPIASNWNKSIPSQCGDEMTAELAAAAFNMALDVGIVFLPLPVIWGLQMDIQKKAAVMATFGLSLGIAAINLARIIQVLRCSLADFTYCTANSAILTVAEMAVGIMVASVPMFGAVVFPERRRRFNKGYRYEPKSHSTLTRLKNSRQQSATQASIDTTLDQILEDGQTIPVTETNQVL
ncbi:integral membrane protein [Penicillium angulare]|uniref:uncharacterized protein n=1 Tax=Penicillium angulare TaxID=116970 RepID=UPI00254108D6|nr:uncharacterized protein N7478_000778 [Penicillium angulare]KAJ5291527.1 integral membrane protein [Penicillium angulare]